MAGPYKVRITVIEKLSGDRVYGDGWESETTEGFVPLCPKVEKGQVFTVEADGSMPDGFCSWAWADIHRDVSVLRFGADFPWMRAGGGATYACCTDGLRPVFFKLERVK